MSRVKSADTKPELVVRHFLHALGFRYRLHDKRLPGKPDMVFPKYRTIVFIHGCFWHGHEHCRYFVVPKTRTEWWLDKIRHNIARDLKTQNELTEKGWKVITIWECQLRRERLTETLEKLPGLITAGMLS